MVNYGKFNLKNNIQLERTTYGLYQESVLLCKEANKKAEKWKNATFWVFDAPEISEKYEDRIEVLRNKKNNSEFPEFVNIIEKLKCNGSLLKKG